MLRVMVYFALVMITSYSAIAAEIGMPAPAFNVRDITGKTQSLTRYRGKIVVLEWNNPGCPFVKKHYGSGNMQSLQQYAVSHGVIWLTINSGAAGKQGYMTANEAKTNLKETGAHQTAYILDPQGKLGMLYGAKTTPHMFVIDAKGNLVYAGAIDDKPTPDKEDVKTARNYVRVAIDELQEGKPVTTSQTHSYGCSIKYKD